MSNSEAIDIAISRCQRDKHELEHGTARAIASAYHHGGDTYAFVSTGVILDSDLYGQLTDDSALYQTGSLSDKRELNWLGTYLVRRIVNGDTGPIDGWSDMWIGDGSYPEYKERV